MATNFDRLVAEFESTLSVEERELYDAFGENFSLERELRALRRAARLSQTQLAAITGISQSEISNIERGKTVPTYPRLRRLVRGMGGDVPILGPGLASAVQRTMGARA